MTEELPLQPIEIEADGDLPKLLISRYADGDMMIWAKVEFRSYIPGDLDSRVYLTPWQVERLVEAIKVLYP